MIEEIVTRLQSETSLVSVDGAEDLAALSKGTAPRHGACFVLPFAESAEPNERATGALLQRVTTQVLVAFVARKHDSAKGAKRVATFDEIKAQIQGALAGWSPSDCEPMELVAGKAAALGNNATVYVQTWQTAGYLEEQP